MPVRPRFRHCQPTPTFIVLAIAGLLAVHTSFAQTQPRSASSRSSGPESDPSLAEGDRLRASGDLAGALRLYRAAQTQSDSAGCQRRIAETEDLLGQHGTAYTEYANLLDRFGSLLDPAQKKAAEKRRRELDELTGVLVLEPLPPDAVVRIDGRPILSSLLSRPIRATRGARRIDVEVRSFKPISLTETIGATTTRVTLNFEPIPTLGVLNVSAMSTAPLTLVVDGKPVGTLPQHLQLPPGDHVVSAEGPTVFAEPRKVTITVSGVQDLTLTVRDKPAVLDIDPVASDSILYVDDRAIGTGARSVELPAGRHVLELRRPGFRTQKLIYEAKAGQRQTLRAAPYVAATTPLLKPQQKPVTSPPKEGAEPPDDAPPKPSAKQDKQDEPRDKEDSRFTGLYGALFIPVMLGGRSTHSYTTACPADAYSGACSTTAPRGGGLALRVGYFYEWVGLEIFGGGAVDVSTAELKLPPIPSVSQQALDLAGRNVFVRAGGFIGGGLRFSTPIQGIRVSLGADYVHVARKVIVVPDSFTGASLGYSVPGFFFDGGIELGSTPGARFYLGAFLFIESARDLVLNRNLSSLKIDPSTVPSSLTTMTVYQGRQYFYGPLLGIAFGH